MYYDSTNSFGHWKDEWPEETYGKPTEWLYAGAKRYIVMFDKKHWNSLYNCWTDRIVKIAGITNSEWKLNLTPQKLLEHIQNEDPNEKIKNACLQKSNYVKDKDGNRIKLDGCFLKDVDKKLK